MNTYTDNDFKSMRSQRMEYIKKKGPMNEPRRTPRVLIGLLGKMSPEVVKKISPEAGFKLREHIKVPIVLFTLSAGLCGGTSLVMMKTFQEICHGNERSENVILAIGLALMGLAMAGL